jgi:thioredoxin-related protein
MQRSVQGFGIWQAAVLVLTLSLAGGAVTRAAEDTWLESYTQAAAAAKAGQKVILADFTGSDWCGWCKKLDKEVFATPEFATWAKEHVVLLKLDFPIQTPQAAAIRKQNQELQQKYGITGYPTILFLDADGKVLGKTGYVPGGPAKWIGCVEPFTKKH